MKIIYKFLLIYVTNIYPEKASAKISQNKSGKINRSEWKHAGIGWPGWRPTYCKHIFAN
jgi:hypothetical protein